MVDRTESPCYELRGVVLHSGTAQGGHYSSLILLDGIWIEFNDIEVSELPEREFEGRAFGKGNVQSFDPGTSAYLLFYVKTGATVTIRDATLRFDDSVNWDSLLDESLVDQIAKSNQEFTRLQSVFQDTMIDIVRAVADPEIAVKYLINVFCHSALSNRVRIMKDIMRNLIEDDPGVVEFVLEFFIAHFAKLKEIFLNCSSDEIMSCFVDFFSQVIELGSDDSIREILNEVLAILPIGLAVSWHQVSKIADCLVSLLQNRRLLELAVGHDWSGKLIDFVSIVYETPRSVMILQNLDLSSVFEILSLLFAAQKDQRLVGILQYSNLITQSSSQAKSFVQIVGRLYQDKQVDLPTFVNTISQSRTDCTDVACEILVDSFSECTDAAAAELMLNQIFPNSPSSVSITILARLKSVKVFFKHPERTILKLLLHDSRELREAALSVATESLFGKTPSVHGMQKEQVDLIRQFYGIAMAYLENLEDLSDHTNCRFQSYIKLLKWLIRGLDLFDSITFSHILDLYKKIENSQTVLVDLNAISCISLLFRFPFDLVTKEFRTLFKQAFLRFDEESSLDEPIRVFVKFKRYFRDATLEDLQFILQSPAIDSVFQKLSLKGSTFKLIGDALVRLNDLQLISRLVFATNPGEIDQKCSACYVNCLKLVFDRLDSFRIQSLLLFCQNSCKLSRPLHEFQLACLIAQELFRNERIAARIGEFESWYFEAPLLYIGCSERPESITSCVDYLVSLFQSRGEQFRNEVSAFLRKGLAEYESFIVAYALLLIREGPENLLEKFLDLMAHAPSADVFFAGLVAAGKLDGTWAKDFLMESLLYFQEQYLQVSKGREFYYRVVAGYSLEDAQRLMNLILEGGDPDSELKWVEVAMLFEALPAFRTQLLKMFPVKNKVTSSNALIREAQTVIFDNKVVYRTKMASNNDAGSVGTGR
jgi:hypothetical protein